MWLSYHSMPLDDQSKSEDVLLRTSLNFLLEIPNTFCTHKHDDWWISQLFDPKYGIKKLSLKTGG